MKKDNIRKPHIVLFVEGETDKIFFERLIQFYRRYSSSQINSCEVKNLRGVTRYTSKMIGKLENEIIPNTKKKGLDIVAVCCSYDTDVFHTSTQPIVDWIRVQREVKRLKIRKLGLIPVEASIEDWLLEDIVGICKYLNLPIVAECKGNCGEDKLMGIFKKANKVYIKGSACQDLILALDIAKIRKVRLRALQELEQMLNVTL